MQEWIENLKTLQDTDLRIRSLAIRLSMIPEEIRKIEAEIKSGKDSLHSSHENMKRHDLDMKRIEGDISAQNTEMRKIQNQSSMVKKNEEYRALMKEIENVKAKIGSLETEQLLLMDKIEKEKAEFREKEKLTGQREKGAMEEIKELKELEIKVGAEIEKLTQLRRVQSEKIPRDSYSLYNRILERGNGSPFVPVEDGNCGNCHLKLIPQTVNTAKKGIAVSCDNCGHLIYVKQ